MKNILLVLFYILAVCFPAHANVPTDRVLAFNRAEGAAIYENYSLNQSFDKDLLGVTTPTGGTASIVTTSGVKLFGKGSLQFAVTSTGQLTAIRSKPFPIGLNGQTCQTKFTYATPYGGAVTQSEFSYFVTNSSGTKISATATLPATFDIAGTQQSKTAVVFYPCPYNSSTPANSWAELTIEHVGSASTSVIIDEKFDMVANDIGAGVPNNVFSANITATTGAVTNENVDWISGNSSTTGTKFTLTLNGGYDATTLGCSASTNKVSTSASNTYNVYATNATTLVVEEYASTSGTAVINASLFLSCSYKGTAFIQPAITPNQWNYGPTAYTPTISSAFGTSTNISFLHWRTGKFLNVLGTFTAGTTANGPVASITLPGSLAIDPAFVTINNTTANPGNELGTFTGGGATSNRHGRMVSATATSTTLMYFSGGSFVGSLLTPSVAASSNVAATGEIVSVSFRIPIQGWTENQNAPQLLGSVTSNANSALRVEYATITNNGSTCTASNQSSTWVASGVRSSTGMCTLTITGSSTFPSWCFGNSTNVVTGYTALSFTTINSTTIVSRTGYGTTDSDANYNLTCIGPR